MSKTATDILLLGRDQELLKATAELLSKAEYRVAQAGNLEQALSLLVSLPIGLIICTKELQDIPGAGLWYYLKNDPLRKNLPFVFFISADHSDPKIQAAEIIYYPLKVEDFLARLRKILPPSEVTPVSPPPIVTPRKVTPAGLDRTMVEEASPLANPSPDKDPPESNRSPAAPRIEVSRDGFLWMPAKVKKYTLQGIFLETTMLSKPGSTLKIRCNLPQGPVIAPGRVAQVSMPERDEPVGLEINFASSEEWKNVFAYMDGQLSSTSSSKPKNKSALGNKLSPVADADTRDLELTLMQPTPAKRDGNDLNRRFYQSLVGKTLKNYTVVSFLGAGALGGVFKGWDTVLEREVAIKIIAYEYSSQEAFVEKFLKEARCNSKLVHPNITQIYSIGHDDDILYYAMEFVSGHSLTQLVKDNGPQTKMKSVSYLFTLCQTLDFIQQNKVVHRDIRPDNIVITKKGELKLMDFGVAKEADNASINPEDDLNLRSPQYLAPEPFMGLRVDHRSDIYSLGATFYYVFTGFPPYLGASLKEIIQNHLEQPLPPLKSKNPKVPIQLCKIIEKMLAKAPEERYQSYKAIISDLNSFCNLVWGNVKKASPNATSGVSALRVSPAA